MDDEIACVSLRKFEKLRTLRCSWSTIIGEEPEDSDLDDEALPEGQFHTSEPVVEKRLNDIAYRLPSSLEALELDGINFEDDQWDAFIQMVQDSKIPLPNLKRIHVKTMGESPLGDLVDVLKERGIAYDEAGEFGSESYEPLERLLDGQGDF
jgi:hypothetical protein